MIEDSIKCTGELLVLENTTVPKQDEYPKTQTCINKKREIQ